MLNFDTVAPRAFANTIDPLVPELWARESIRLLEENMVMGGLVHRDFSKEVAKYGDTVHTRKPAALQAKRKTVDDNVTVQNVSAVDVEVKLDQHIHVSFVIKDLEQTTAFKDLVTMFLEPAIIANARVLDQALLGNAVQFLGNTAGGLAQLSSSNAHAYLVSARQKLNEQKCPNVGRHLVLGAASEARMLETDLFISAERVGDGGTAMREAELGKKFGFGTYMDLNTPSAAVGGEATATTTTAAHAKGVSVINVTSVTNIAVGTYFTVAGDMTPLRATAINTLAVTVSRPTMNAIGSGAVVTPITEGTVDLGADYVNGYVKEIHVDGGPAPQVGQMVSFVDTSGGGLIRAPEYTIMQVTNTAGSDYDILLDRPLETALADDDVVGYGPAGELNLAFSRNAIALVNRPMLLPMGGSGARAAFVSHNGLSMRVVITYDGNQQGHLVTVDSLFGTKTLDTDLGCILLG